MKHLRFIFPLMLCCIVAGLMTSCLNDDNDDNGLTYEQRLQAFQTVRGNYSGKAICYNRAYSGISAPTAKDIDSTDVHFSMLTDSTARVFDFPLSAVANQVKDDELANALLTASPAYVQLDMVTQYNSVSPVMCLIGVKPVTLSLNYGGSAHQVEIGFSYGYIGYRYYVSSGVYDADKGKFNIRLLLGGIKVDGNDVSSSALFNDSAHGVILIEGHR